MRAARAQLAAPRPPVSVLPSGPFKTGALKITAYSASAQAEHEAADSLDKLLAAYGYGDADEARLMRPAVEEMMRLPVRESAGFRVRGFGELAPTLVAVPALREIRAYSHAAIRRRLGWVAPPWQRRDVLHSFGSGWTVESVETLQDQRLEGALMWSCFVESFLLSSGSLASLRNPHGWPQADIFTTTSGAVWITGRGEVPLRKPKLAEMVREYLAATRQQASSCCNGCGRRVIVALTAKADGVRLRQDLFFTCACGAQTSALGDRI